MKKIKFSIILPIYNVETYLVNCVNSILSQNYDDYEIILVDDGSTDKSGKICDYLKLKDNRIKVIHKKNGGLSSARNEGLKNSSGDYIIFLDSDDFWVKSTFLSDISDMLKDEDLIIFNSYKYFDESTKIVPRFKLESKFYSLNNCKKLEYIIANNIYKACAWDKVIKASILKQNKIEFPSGLLSEDMEWCGKLLQNISKVNVYSDVVYAYRQRNSSISKSVNLKHLEDIYNQIFSGIKVNNYLVLNYFAYEFIILYSYTFSLNDENFKIKVKNLCWLLKYKISKKVKIVYVFYKIFGFKICGFFLKSYLKLK